MIQENISLKKYNTFGLNIKADRLITLRDEKNAARFLERNGEKAGKTLILGSGSNILFTDDFHGTVIHPNMGGITLEESTEDYVIVSAGAGVIWDDLVEITVSRGLGGLENLSYIPGTCGAAAVQNIGAYGCEAKDTITRVRALGMKDGLVREFLNSDCRFGYRDSIFKNELKGQYLITRVCFRLSARPLLNVGYGSLKEETGKMGAHSLENVRKAVINARKTKLPEPSQIGNAGSFFKNPVVSGSMADELKTKYPSMPLFSDPSGKMKIPAAWLIEKCGWKGKRIGDAGIYENHALVIVNHGKASGKELLDLSEKITRSVHEEFGIIIEREVQVI